jgi:hypothetical protein
VALPWLDVAGPAALYSVAAAVLVTIVIWLVGCRDITWRTIERPAE